MENPAEVRRAPVAEIGQIFDRCNVSGNGCIPDGMWEESVRRLDEVAVDNPERVRSPESFRRSRLLFYVPVRPVFQESPVWPCRD